MTQTFQTSFKTTLAEKLLAADTTMEVATAPTVTAGRLKIGTGSSAEWVSFTGVSGTTLTGLTRGLSKTAVPATAGTGSTWIAGTAVKLVAMHDQLPDKQQSTDFTDDLTVGDDFTVTGDSVMGTSFKGPVYASLAALNSAFPSPANGLQSAYCTSEGQIYDALGGSWQARASGSTPNGSTAVAGKYQSSTQAQTDSLTILGGTGAQLVTQQDYVPATEKTSPDSNDFWVLYDSTDSNHKKYVKQSTIVNQSNALNFGDGADGNVNISTTVTLTKDMFYDTLTIASGGILKTNGYKVFCKTACIIQAGGNIDRSGTVGGLGGNNSGMAGGIGGVAATSLNQGTLQDIVAAVAGATGAASPAGPGVAGTAGTNASPSYSVINGVAGGAGETTGDPGGAGGAGGTSSRGALYNVVYKRNEIVSIISNPASFASIFSATSYKGLSSSGGGGSGSSSNSNGGGGGGGSGGNAGVIWIAAARFDNQGTITSIGGIGGAGGSGFGGGGGGGGGQGGIFYLIYSVLTNLGTVTLTGGVGGAPGGGAAAGTNGNNGVTISVQI